MSDLTKDPITCHVLDTSTGLPAADLYVELFCSSDLYLFSAITNSDGRISNWTMKNFMPEPVTWPSLADILLREGTATWTLKFDTAGYFGRNNTLFPEVLVSISVNPGEEYHVPLLLGPYSYTTYRGS